MSAQTDPAACCAFSCVLNVGFRLRAPAADLERCEQRLGADRYGEWLAVLTAHDVGSIDTTEAVERAKAALSIGPNHSLILQLNRSLSLSFSLSLCLSLSQLQLSPAAFSRQICGSALCR